MLYFTPLPIYEARNFFVSLASGDSPDAQFNYIVRSPSMASEASKYFDILSELFAKLKESITVDDSVISMLFVPMRKLRSEGGIPSFLSTCDMLVRRTKEYSIRSTDDFFRLIREQKAWIPSSLVERLFDEPFRTEEPISAFDAMKRICSSDIPDDEKLRALQLLVDPDRYIDAFEAAICPVAHKFESCAELYSPLIDLFRSDYSGMSELEILGGLFQNFDESPRVIDIYPSIMTVQNSAVSFVNGSSEEIVIFMGTLQRFDEEYLVACGNDRERLFSMLSSFSNQSRYLIMCRLAESPAYGRELAAYLNLTPGTISQHLSILAGFGLINVTSDGTRLYYSVNKEQMEQFIEMQKRVFLDGPDSD